VVVTVEEGSDRAVVRVIKAGVAMSHAGDELNTVAAGSSGCDSQRRCKRRRAVGRAACNH
jgi:hypothetical protein